MSNPQKHAPSFITLTVATVVACCRNISERPVVSAASRGTPTSCASRGPAVNGMNRRNPEVT
jgi:hypothetical protein